jgi:hypothetical protein
MTRTTSIDVRLKEFCSTPRQAEYIDAVNEHKGVLAAAQALGIDYRTLSEGLKTIRDRAALKGYSPEHHLTRPIAPGLKMRGTSQLFKQGQAEPLLEWVKTSADEDRREEMMREALAVLSQEFRGLAPFIAPPAHASDDLLCAIPVGDPHNGLYVWAQECGADFDTDIARRIALSAADRLVSSAPMCSVGILLLLGDILHANDQSNATPGHKHQLDVDTRFVRVLGIVIEMYRQMALRMLERFPRVILKLIPGNHDPQSVWALAYALSAYFCNEPRVTVDLGPSKFWYYSFGKVLIGSTHGDTVKPEKLPGIMAADKPEEWGASRFRYWYTGHIHSKNSIEFPGVMWESFRTLAPQDAYAASHGYRSGRDMVAIVHHREFGEVERHRVDVGMLS